MSHTLQVPPVPYSTPTPTDSPDYRAWLADAPAMLTAASPAGDVVFASAAAAAALGHAREALEGMPLAGLYHPDDRAALHAALDEALRAPGTEVRRELRRIRADGTELWVDETLRALAGPGEPVVAIHTQDATERRWAGEALARSA